MKFYIRRTSGDEPPCPKSFKENDGGYYIEINNLDELMELVNENGDIVISSLIREKEIEIYDDYRE